MNLAFLAIAVLLAGLQAPPTANASVSGTVTESGTNTPLAGVRIEFNRRFSAVTDNTGQFTAKDITPGNYAVTAALDGYLIAGRTSDVSPASITIVRSPTTALGTIAIPAGAAIQGFHISPGIGRIFPDRVSSF